MKKKGRKNFPSFNREAFFLFFFFLKKAISLSRIIMQKVKNEDIDRKNIAESIIKKDAKKKNILNPLETNIKIS